MRAQHNFWKVIQYILKIIEKKRIGENIYKRTIHDTNTFRMLHKLNDSRDRYHRLIHI